MVSETTAGARTVAYVSNADSREIYVLEVDERDGRARVVERVFAGGRVMPMAIGPNRGLLFAALRSEPYSVISFAVDPASGRLARVATSPLAGDMAYVSTDRTGRYLFAASYFGDKVSVNAVAPGGEVSPEPLAVIPTGRHAHAVATDPSNRFLFVTILGEDAILQFRFDAASGRVEPNAPPSVAARPGAGPRHLAFHPSRPFVFCSDELGGTVSAYRLGDSGALTPLGSASVLPAGFAGEPWAADVRLTPDGGFLYASERRSSTVSAFRVHDDGGLTRVGVYPTEAQPRGIGVAPSGRYLLAAGERSNGVSTHAIDPESGALSARTRLEVGGGPNWVELVALPRGA